MDPSCTLPETNSKVCTRKWIWLVVEPTHLKNMLVKLEILLRYGRLRDAWKTFILFLFGCLAYVQLGKLAVSSLRSLRS